MIDEKKMSFEELYKKALEAGEVNIFLDENNILPVISFITQLENILKEVQINRTKMTTGRVHLCEADDNEFHMSLDLFFKSQTVQ